MMSDPFYGSIAFRTPTDIASGQPVANRVAGHPVPERFIEASTPGQTQWKEEEPFDPALYLLANPDVAAAGVDAATHYLQYGRREQRRLRP